MFSKLLLPLDPSKRLKAATDYSLTLARRLHPGQRNSLDALCKRYEVDASKRDVHGALIDSELLARVYLAMTGGQTALSLDEESGRTRDRAAAVPRRREGESRREQLVRRAACASIGVSPWACRDGAIRA